MNKPRIILYDLEISPTLAFVYEKYNTNVLAEERPWIILSYAYKYLGRKKIHVASLPDFPLYKRDKLNDKALVKSLHKILNNADITIAHNGNKFDYKKAIARFIFHNLKPPRPNKQIDTLLAARRYAGFFSNSLNDLAKFFGLDPKKDHHSVLWQDCLKGDPKAWRRMKAYNKYDVFLLEKIYQRLLPYMENHPNLNLYTQTPFNCPNCSSYRLKKDGIRIHSNGQRVQRYQCLACGKWSREKLPTPKINIR